MRGEMGFDLRVERVYEFSDHSVVRQSDNNIIMQLSMRIYIGMPGSILTIYPSLTGWAMSEPLDRSLNSSHSEHGAVWVDGRKHDC